MSLADQIVALIETGWTNSTAIGNRVGCSDAYVRTVKQRRITNVMGKLQKSREYQRKWGIANADRDRWTHRRSYWKLHHDIDIGEWKG